MTRSILGGAVPAALAALILLLVGCGQREQSAREGPPPGQPSEPGAARDEPPRSAPAFSLTTLQGKTVRLRDFKGKPLVLNFWASWSPRCVTRASALEALYQEYKPQGLQMLGIGVDAEDDVKRRAEQMKLTYPVGVSAEAARSYGVTEIPHTFFISREGKILASLLGAEPIACLEAGAEMVIALEGSGEYRAARAILDAHLLYKRGDDLLRRVEEDTTGELGEERDRLLEEARENYEGALALKPDLAGVLWNLSAVLLQQARGKSEAEAERLYRLGLEKAVEAHRVEPGAGAYNAACAYALLGEQEECRKWLATAREFDALPSVDHIRSDPDLESVRDREWFRAYLHR